MEKTFIALICMTVGLLSCSNDDIVPEEQTPTGLPMTFNISVDINEAALAKATTGTAKTSWVNTDKIYVFFNGLATKYLILEYDGTKWNSTSGGGTLLDTDLSSLGTKTLTAVYFPVVVDITYADSKFSFTSDGKPVYNYYLHDTNEGYVVDGTTVNATLSMSKPSGMAQFHVAGIQDNVADYTFGCSKIRPVSCKSVATDGSLTEDVLQAGARLSGFADSNGGIFAGRLTSPDAAADYVFTVASNDHIYTLTRSNRTLTAGKMYNFPSLSTTGGSNWAITATADLYVDLGLSVKWAKYNVGATTETESGDYFAWGEVTGYNEGKTTYDWSTYAYGSSYNTLTKYCNKSNFGNNGYTDALTILLPEDDAAHAALGGKFRMPTRTELKELIDNCTWTWTTRNGINGRLITSSKNGNSIFLPAAGHRANSYLADSGSNGFYRTSSLDLGDAYLAFSLVFSSSEVFWQSYPYRYTGYSVRPVYAE